MTDQWVYVRRSPGFLFLEVPKKGEYRFIFKDRVCITLLEAYEYARSLVLEVTP